MLAQLAANPLLFSTLKVNSQQHGLENLTADLRVRSSGEGTNPISGEILSVRVVHSLGWNPDQRLYFEATQGSVTLTGIDAQNAQLTGEIPGLYRLPVTDPAQFLGDGDFREAPTFPATLGLSLLLSLPAPDAVVPQVSGSLSIQSEAFALDFGTQRIDATVAGEARLFPHDLPSRDFSGQAYIYFLEVQPVLVQETAGTIFKSTGRLLGGAVRIWQEGCGIQIIQKAPFPLMVDHSVIESLERGNTNSLREVIRQVPRGDGVPVAFVQPLFAAGGGEASDHGPQRAIVVVTEKSDGNETLLAHELGHVLGGKETGSPQTADYWVGDPGTVMEASGDVSIPAPGVVDGFTCEHARKFALWRKVL
ncbi:MAG: hypothetical protein QOF89_208 [Acidobacteriota bacterium]|jgi:hypothetical protein|nr:hypothetical protein [Acidobacteriota bacterium]